MDVAVTDHHQPPETLPDCVVVNPHVGDYGFPDLCGAGVAFQLARALSDLNTALGHIDLAAIATVADIVPLTGDRRDRPAGSSVSTSPPAPASPR